MIDEPIATSPEMPPEGAVEGGVRYFPDGSAAIETAPRAPAPPPQAEENLAFVLSPEELKRIGYNLLESIQQDKESQQQFLGSVGDALKILGIDAVRIMDGGLDTGETGKARNINSSALFETLLDLTATIMSSIYPTRNPVSCQILGVSTEELEEASLRKGNFFNAWLQYSDKGFDKELRRIVFWSILTGSIYCKVYIDSVLGRPTVRMIPLDRFIVNRDLSSHLAAVRKTQVHEMSAREYHVRKRNGEYRDIRIQPESPMEDGVNPVRDSLAEISASPTPGSESEDYKVYNLYECHIETVIAGDPQAEGAQIPLPYIITLDEVTGDILRITRNWDDNDPLKRRKESFVNFSFLPSLDGEGYGLIQTSAASAQTASEILRELITAGSYASMPSGFISPLMHKKGVSLTPAPGKFIELQTQGPIEQSISPLPFKEPSNTLLELKTQLEDSVRRPSAIINHKVAEMTPQAPMGSTLALLESLHKIPNFILQGYHQSFGEVLMLLNETFYNWLPDNAEYPFKVPGQNQVMMKADFQPHLQVMPSSDPTLQNSGYRLMRADLILNNALKMPDLHNMREVEKLFYKSLQIPEDDIEHILAPDPHNQEPPPALDPISENGRILQSQPVKVYIPQDHQAHIEVHKSLTQSPDVENNHQMMGAIQAHIYEHMAFHEQQVLAQKTGINLPEDPASLPMEAQNQIAQAAAQALGGSAPEGPPPNPDLINAQAAMVSAEAEKNMVEVRARQAELEAETHNNKLMLDKEKLDLERAKVEVDQNIKAKKLVEDSDMARSKDNRDAIKTDVDVRKGEMEVRRGEMDILEKSRKVAEGY